MEAHFSDQLTGYVDGILRPEEAATVAAHLAECSDCRVILDDLLAVRKLLRSLPEHAPHPSLLPRTLPRLETRPVRRMLPRWIVATMVGAAALALALQLPLLPRPHPDQSASVWYFQRHAEFSSTHPMADTTLASYLSTVLPYELFEESSGIPGTQ